MLERDVLANFDAITSREWLVTNGLGGYASGTLSGCNTRRYHGLLVASMRPPVERFVMVAKLDASAHYRGVTFALSSNEYADGTIDPRGDVNLQSFELDGQTPVWQWSLADALIEQRIWMTHGANITYVTYKVLHATDAIELHLTPLCAYRDYHSHSRGAHDFFVSQVENGIQLDAHWGAHPYRILLDRGGRLDRGDRLDKAGGVDKGEFKLRREWYWNFKHRIESERGLDDLEDLFCPAQITMRLQPGETCAVILTAESSQPMSADESLQCERLRQQALLGKIDSAEPMLHRLTLATDQFIVERGVRSQPNLPSLTREGAEGGKTVIAGYPWFSDWGRDTMIALPGLALATHRYDEAASILRTFAKFVSEGMLPNRFPDAGETPEYNTVDATLWYFVAIHEYFERTADAALIKELFPILRDIIDWHQRGTRYGIHVDAEDGLLFAGEAGVQLTWMDAKIGDWVVTARIGKPVEINALWFNALMIMQRFATLLHDAAAQLYAVFAERVKVSFNQKYLSASAGHLCDVIHGPEGEQASNGKRYDTTMRPNQLLALSLPYPLLEGDQARAIVDVCARELWTPVGMRSLSPRDPRYVGRYTGGPRDRDAVYHQGTAWSWLLGPFVIAHYRAYGDAGLALSYLEGVSSHLRDACVGQISEIFDGDAPFTPRGCFAQAWGVSEVLRAWMVINEE
jgi:predicted glycogen debranching enzyme